MKFMKCIVLRRKIKKKNFFFLPKRILARFEMSIMWSTRLKNTEKVEIS